MGKVFTLKFRERWGGISIEIQCEMVCYFLQDSASGLSRGLRFRLTGKITCENQLEGEVKEVRASSGLKWGRYIFGEAFPLSFRVRVGGFF